MMQHKKCFTRLSQKENNVFKSYITFVWLIGVLYQNVWFRLNACTSLLYSQIIEGQDMSATAGPSGLQEKKTTQTNETEKSG